MTWFAIYTLPRAEKKAHAELLKKGIDAYLPLQRTLKQWSDRKKWIDEPLFRSYIFVNIPDSQYFDVLNTNAVIRYITFEGKAVPIPQKQIEAIRYFLAVEVNESDLPEDTQMGLAPGSLVEITRGPLRGLTGQLINFNGRQRVRIEIEALGQFLNLNVSRHDLKLFK